MENFQIKYSPTLDIKSVPLDKYEKDFTFIVNGKHYKTSRFIADLISPIVSKYHFNDESIREFSIKSQINKQEKHQNYSDRDFFQEFLDLYQCDDIKIDPIARKYYLDYFLQLGNINEYIKLQPEYFEGLNSENIFIRLNNLTNSINTSSNKKQKTNDLMSSLVNSQAIDNMINYISSHFEEIDKEQLKALDKGIIEKIIISDSLILDEEDSILKFIIELTQNDQTYSNLFEYVYFVNVKEETLEEFVNCFSPEFINCGIWMKICQRLLRSRFDDYPMERYYEKVTEINYSRDNEWKGLLHYLTQKVGGNIHDNGIVTISSSNSYDELYCPKNLVEYEKDDYFRASDSYANVLFDFRDKKIQLNGYLIKSTNNSSGSYHLKNWVIEGSNDQQNWTNIDERSENSNLNNNNRVDIFNVKQNDQFYRFIRLRETRNNWYNSSSNTFFSCIEFYGKLKETINQKK